MPYIGNTVQNQGFAPAIDYFSGDGTTVTFTLSRPIASVAQVIVAIDNVIQNPSSSFTVAGNSITFTSAPLSGTNNIWVEYTSLITTYAAISQDPTVIGDIRATGGYLAEGDFGNSYIDGTIVDYVTGNARITTGPIDNMTFYHGGTSARSEMMELYYAGGAKIYGTTALTIPVGTTAQRPTGAAGMIRMNTTTGYPEWYDTTTNAWVKFSSAPYTINYLVIAGGGGGGSNQVAYNGGGGGGGAGGYRCSVSGESSGGGGSAESPITATPGTTYTITVGAGGAGGANQAVANGTNGNNSVFATITSVGGGGGAKSSGSANNGVAGGSGGGAGGDTGSGGSGTANQGYAGGARTGSPTTYGGSGGGGAGGAGVAGATGDGTAGGAGVSSSITGSAVTRAGGGGGGAYNVSAGGAGGSGGGGAGGGNSAAAISATANTGSGGGGVGAIQGTGGAGGSGVVILSMLSSAYSGITTGSPTVTTSGANTILTYTSSGTYTA